MVFDFFVIDRVSIFVVCELPIRVSCHRQGVGVEDVSVCYTQGIKLLTDCHKQGRKTNVFLSYSR